MNCKILLFLLISFLLPVFLYAQDEDALPEQRALQLLKLDCSVKNVTFVWEQIRGLPVNPLDNRFKPMRERKLLAFIGYAGILNTMMDPSYNEEDRPVTRVPVPGTLKYQPGIAPELVKEPDLRRDYEKAIAANSAKANFSNLQMDIRTYRARTLETINRFIVQFYEDSERAGLKTLLHDKLGDDAVKTVFKDITIGK